MKWYTKFAGELGKLILVVGLSLMVFEILNSHLNFNLDVTHFVSEALLFIGLASVFSGLLRRRHRNEIGAGLGLTVGAVYSLDNDNPVYLLLGIFLAAAGYYLTGQLRKVIGKNAGDQQQQGPAPNRPGNAPVGWVTRLLSAILEPKVDSIRLDHPKWELGGPATFSELLQKLSSWLPVGSTLYFEGGYPDVKILGFFAEHSVPEPVHVETGTRWPRPEVFHVPATEAAMKKLADIMDDHPEPALAIHFHVYRDREVLLQWHDAFSQPILLSGAFSEDQVAALAERFGTSYRSMIDRHQ